ncbi:MAG: beta-N-acetylhexosaminidase [Clostridiales bacterium]|nr:beta-N-acetylhexosaminidase [Clostridiales bacterium]
MILFPQPRFITLGEGEYQFEPAAAREGLKEFYDRVTSGLPGIRVTRSPLCEKEEYRLEINENGAELTAGSDEGVFRAATSLWQMIRRFGGCLQYMSVQDKPELPRRGYMLDISRGRKPKVETIKTMIDYLASLKYNELQLYMEGECFKYEAYPEETKDFDCLTPADIRELDAYCRDRFIDLVPNQNSFGHMYTWLKKPAFRHLGLYEGDEVPSTLNPLLPESFEFMRKLYASLLPNFSSEYVNIGLDEAYGLGKYQIEEYCREKGKDTVFMEWLNKLSSHISETYGKKVMFWADMIYNYPQSYHLVPKDAVALEWGYELIQSQRMTDHCIAYRNAGVRYYVCPSTNTHGCFTGRMDVTTFNIRTCGELATEYGAEGILLTDWGDGGHPQSWIWSVNPIALCGQYGWNTGAKQDGETFKADFIRNAETYADEYFFGGAPLSRLMYRMANYYLLEPERVHVCTMSFKELTLPMNVTRYAHLFDMKDSGDDFYFDNVISYVRRVMDDIEKLDFDETWKREIRLTARFVELGAEVCKVKLHPEASKGKARELAETIDALLPEYKRLWDLRNYERGVEKFMEHLAARRDELLELAGE